MPSLAGKGQPVLGWQARLKIAVGTARGLRYLHEDCRVGCIIHRNLRPNKILLTHDFEPLVYSVSVLQACSFLVEYVRIILVPTLTQHSAE